MQFQFPVQVPMCMMEVWPFSAYQFIYYSSIGAGRASTFPMQDEMGEVKTTENHSAHSSSYGAASLRYSSRTDSKGQNSIAPQPENKDEIAAFRPSGSSVKPTERNSGPRLSMDFHINIPLSARPYQTPNLHSHPKSTLLQPNQESLSQHSSAHKDLYLLQQNKAVLNCEQQQKVRDCLCTIESSLGLSFDTDTILKQVVIIDDARTLKTNSRKSLMQGCLCEDHRYQEGGICIVDDGELDVLASHEQESILTNILKPGDFYGELWALFLVPCPTYTRASNKYDKTLLAKTLV